MESKFSHTPIIKIWNSLPTILKSPLMTRLKMSSISNELQRLGCKLTNDVARGKPFWDYIGNLS